MRKMPLLDLIAGISTKLEEFKNFRILLTLNFTLDIATVTLDGEEKSANGFSVQ